MAIDGLTATTRDLERKPTPLRRARSMPALRDDALAAFYERADRTYCAREAVVRPIPLLRPKSLPAASDDASARFYERIGATATFPGWAAAAWCPTPAGRAALLAWWTAPSSKAPQQPQTLVSAYLPLPAAGGDAVLQYNPLEGLCRRTASYVALGQFALQLGLAPDEAIAASHVDVLDRLCPNDRRHWAEKFLDAGLLIERCDIVRAKGIFAALAARPQDMWHGSRSAPSFNLGRLCLKMSQGAPPPLAAVRRGNAMAYLAAAGWLELQQLSALALPCEDVRGLLEVLRSPDNGLGLLRQDPRWRGELRNMENLLEHVLPPPGRFFDPRRVEAVLGLWPQLSPIDEPPAAGSQF